MKIVATQEIGIAQADLLQDSNCEVAQIAQDQVAFLNMRQNVRTGLLIIATIATQTKVHPLLFEQIIDGLNAQNSRRFTMLVSTAGKDVRELFAQFDGGAVLDQNAFERTA